MRTILLLAIAAALLTAVSASAQPTWTPGSPLYILEKDANRYLERTFDFAYCRGIPRFGQRGEFPYEKFLRFDCTTERGDTYCANGRYRSVRGSRSGTFRVLVVTKPRCY